MSIPLAKMRKQIDKIDKKILTLLRDRKTVVENIGHYKKVNGLEVLDRDRWLEVLESRTKQGETLGISRELIVAIWDAIHEESLRIEKSR